MQRRLEILTSSARTLSSFLFFVLLFFQFVVGEALGEAVVNIITNGGKEGGDP